VIIYNGLSDSNEIRGGEFLGGPLGNSVTKNQVAHIQSCFKGEFLGGKTYFTLGSICI